MIIQGTKEHVAWFHGWSIKLEKYIAQVINICQRSAHVMFSIYSILYGTSSVENKGTAEVGIPSSGVEVLT